MNTGAVEWYTVPVTYKTHGVLLIIKSGNSRVGGRRMEKST